MMIAALLLVSVSLDPEQYLRAVAATHDPANLYIGQCIHKRGTGGFEPDAKCASEQIAARNRIIDRMEAQKIKADRGDEQAEQQLSFTSAMINLAVDGFGLHIDYVQL
jgi:hypothetical protein